MGFAGNPAVAKSRTGAERQKRWRERRIKADPAMRSIPIIAVTSHALDGEEQAARAGCDGYVPEPYSPSQLLAKIQQCMPQ